LNSLIYLIKGHLDHDAYMLDELAEWVKEALSGGDSLAQNFQMELRAALDQQGMVTPALYKRWTGENLEDQESVQERLQEIWDACFG